MQKHQQEGMKREQQRNEPWLIFYCWYCVLLEKMIEYTTAITRIRRRIYFLFLKHCTWTCASKDVTHAKEKKWGWTLQRSDWYTFYVNDLKDPDDFSALLLVVGNCAKEGLIGAPNKNNITTFSSPIKITSTLPSSFFLFLLQCNSSPLFAIHHKEVSITTMDNYKRQHQHYYHC